MTRPGMANPLHWEATDSDVLWSPGNVSEAIPGVSTALNWSFIDDAIELATRRAFHSLGLLRRDELTAGDRAEDRFMVCFYGRTVANIEAMRVLGPDAGEMEGSGAQAPVVPGKEVRPMGSLPSYLLTMRLTAVTSRHSVESTSSPGRK